MISFSDFYPIQFIIKSVDRIIYNVTLIIASFYQKPANILIFLLFIAKFLFIALIFIYFLVLQYLTKFYLFFKYLSSAPKTIKYSFLSFLWLSFSNPMTSTLSSPVQECFFCSILPYNY